MLQTDITGGPIVILKHDPSDARLLREASDDVTPGYHMDERHWITLQPDGDLTPGMVDELVTEFYLLVIEGLHTRSVQSIPKPSLLSPDAHLRPYFLDRGLERASATSNK